MAAVVDNFNYIKYLLPVWRTLKTVSLSTGRSQKYRKSEVRMTNFISLAIPDKAIKVRNLHLTALLLNVKSSHTQHKQRL